MFATIKGFDDTKPCPKCGKRASWQSKGLWLTYKGQEFWIGDYQINKLDENMNGEITAWCLKVLGGCGESTKFEIIKGKLKQSNKH